MAALSIDAASRNATEPWYDQAPGRRSATAEDAHPAIRWRTARLHDTCVEGAGVTRGATRTYVVRWLIPPNTYPIHKLHSIQAQELLRAVRDERVEEERRACTVVRLHRAGHVLYLTDV